GVGVSTASTESSGSHTSRVVANGARVPLNSRSRKAIEAAFDATDKYAVTVVGAPSYASGAHIWNGAAAILNSSPTNVVASARNTTGSHGCRCATAAAISVSLVEPAIPYSTENPYTRKPVANAPSSRYFSAASFDRLSPRRNPTIT